MTVRFLFPYALLLLVVVPWAVRMGARVRLLSPFRKWTAIALRVLILLALIGALAGVEIVRTQDRLAVFFVLDRSSSIPESTREACLESVREACDLYMTPKDKAGVIVFGEDASIELAVGPRIELDIVLSYIGGEQTNVAGAVRLAMAAFPQGYMKRIVLFTDGNETQGSALEELKLARASGIGLHVVPLQIGGSSEVRIRELSAPCRVSADEPFKLKAVIHADQDCEGALRVYQAGRLLQSANVTLQKGDNAFLLPQELKASGFYEYEATIESAADSVAANNEGRAFTVVQGEPKVLYIEADPEHSKYLEPALVGQGVRVVRADFGSMPATLSEFQNFDAVVLSNVSATQLPTDVMKAMEAMVRDLGIGLVMIGGPQSFGAGGFFDTPIERAVPVSMDIKQRKIMPRGALVLIMHTCEMPQGNTMSREIGLAALNVLSSQDLMGALAYRWQGGEGWLYELQPVGDKTMMSTALKTPDIGDMPSVQSTLQMAYDALKEADASVKRIIIISDGDPAAPSPSLLDALVEAKIPVSTVCIAPHQDTDQKMLSGIAHWTGGEYYFVTNPNNLPQIFAKEAAVVKRALLIEEPFTPVPLHDSELLHGFDTEHLPTLQGYVVTTPKENATLALVSHEGDPILAQWRYGLGKSVAFTSDVTPRWAPDWLAWSEFNRFWAQTVRWATRETAPSSFSVTTGIRDRQGYVRIDAVDDQGKFVNFLRPTGSVTGPSPDFRRQDLDLLQTGPGVYEGTFPIEGRGVYMLNLSYTRQDGSQGVIPAGLALNYSREYEYNTTNLALLEQMARLSVDAQPGDAAVALNPPLSAESIVPRNPFEHSLKTTPIVSPIWQILVAVAACLFPIEIFVRRVVINIYPIYLWALLMLRKVPGLSRLIPAPKRRAVRATGGYGAALKPSTTLIYGAHGAPIMPAGPAGPVRPVEASRARLDASEAELEGAEQELGPTPPDYTHELLAAKERARKKYDRRSQASEEEKD